jgi:hypothetical protein
MTKPIGPRPCSPAWAVEIVTSVSSTTVPSASWMLGTSWRWGAGLGIIILLCGWQSLRLCRVSC